MKYAYSILETKNFDEDDDKVTVKGIASTPSPDRHLDIVEPSGAKFETPMPLLWQHDHTKPVGHVVFAEPNDEGIPFVAEIPKVSESGILKDRIDEAIQSLKYKLVAAVSIGFNSDDYDVMKNGGFRFNTWDWLELSLVTIPANPEAKISLVKQLDRKTLAALGEKAERKEEKTGDTVKKHKVVNLLKRY